MTITASTPLRPLALPFPVTPRQAGAATADLSPLVLAHRALLSGMRLLADAVADIARGGACPTQRHEAVSWFAEHVLHEVAEHHRKEDDILWPVIAVSAGPHVDLDALCDEHGVLQSVLDRTQDALRIFVTHRDLGAPMFAAALAELATDLGRHIAAEEAVLFPVISEYVSKHDFDRVEARFAKHNPYAHLLFMQPWLASVCTEVDSPACAARVPWRARLGSRRRAERWMQRVDLVVGASGR